MYVVVGRAIKKTKRAVFTIATDALSTSDCVGLLAMDLGGMSTVLVSEKGQRRREYFIAKTTLLPSDFLSDCQVCWIFFLAVDERRGRCDHEDCPRSPSQLGQHTKLASAFACFQWLVDLYQWAWQDAKVPADQETADRRGRRGLWNIVRDFGIGPCTSNCTVLGVCE